MNEERKKYYFVNKSLFVMVIIATLFMGVGYAAINNISLQVSGNVVGAALNNVVYISDVSVSSSSGETGRYNSFHECLADIEMNLSDSNDSSIVYNFNICNDTGNVYIFDSISTDDENLFYTNHGIGYDILSDDGGILKPNECLNIKVKFYYVDGYYGSDAFDTRLKCYLKFNFDKAYSVTYENFSSTENYPQYVAEGDSLNVSFGKLDSPIEVKKSNVILNSSDYTYSNYSLILNSVDGHIHIRKLGKYSIVNLVNNGSFENGLTGWRLIGSSNSWYATNIAAYGSNAYYRIPSEKFENYLSQNISWIEGHTYYYFAHSICTSEQKFVIDVYLKGGLKTITSVPTGYRRASILYTADFSGENAISINFDTTTDNVIVDGIGIVDLTAAFGSGNEPDLDWCDQNIDYFDGEMIVYK